MALVTARIRADHDPKNRLYYGDNLDVLRD
jgi:hypothetical protein